MCQCPDVWVIPYQMRPVGCIHLVWLFDVVIGSRTEAMSALLEHQHVADTEPDKYGEVRDFIRYVPESP